MSIKKLPSNAEFILRELVKADNPSGYLKTLYDNSSKKEQDELSGIIAELKEGLEGEAAVKFERCANNVVFERSSRYINKLENLISSKN